MDISNPYGKDMDKKKEDKKSKPTPKKKEKEEEKNLYSDMLDDDDDDDMEDDEDEDEGSLDDEDGEEYEEEVPFFKKPIGILVIVLGLAIIGAVVYFVFIKKDPPPPAPPAEEMPVEEALDPTEELKGELYKMGIGKEAVDEQNIYDQGPIESADFRKDFVSTDSPENYTLPIEIVAVNDSVSYTKHRTMTDDGIDMYWLDAEYKGKKVRFTSPYYIWQTLAPQGVMDVIVEVVTDAEGRTFVSSVTPVPPTTEE